MANTYIPSSDLSFDAYKASLKTFLRNQERFKDYDFEGSNLSVIIDLLTYNTFNNAHYLNMIGSEMFLDSAQMRESIVSHAKELNYVPRSRTSARAVVTVEVVPGGSPASITIPKYYAFKTTSTTSNAVKFITDQSIVMKRNGDGRYLSEPITIYEGIPVTEVFTVVPTNNDNGSVTYNQRFNLQSDNVDVDSIEVSVAIDGNDLTPLDYKRAVNLYGLNNDSRVFFVRGYKGNNYEIEFGDGVLGAAVEAGNRITIRYRDTIGADGNGTYVFTKTTSVDGYSAVTVTTSSRANGGSERESNDSIKYNAVRHFQVQDRAVIESDYHVLIKSNFPEVQDVNVYGGELVYDYGKVIISLKPYNVDSLIDDNTKTRIIAFLKTKNIVPEPIVVDPEYFYLGITGNVYYNVNKTLQRKNEVLANVVNALVDLNGSTLGTFNTTVYQSLINTTIVNADVSIQGADVELTMIRRIIPNFGVSTAYSFTTNNRIISSPQGEYINSDQYSVTTNLFQIIINDVISDVVIQDDGVGHLHLYQIINGVKVKVPIPVGTVDYTSGKVLFTVDVYNVSQKLQVTCRMADNSIAVNLNKFISVDGADIDLVMADND